MHVLAPQSFAARAALVVLAEIKDLALSRAHQTLAIGTADMETARALASRSMPCRRRARCAVTDAAGVVIYIGEITCPGDCVHLNIELSAIVGGERRREACANGSLCRAAALQETAENALWK